MKNAAQARRRIALFCFVSWSVLAVTGNVTHSNHKALAAGFASGRAPNLSKPHPAAQREIVESYGRLPLAFESNQGQADQRVKFLSRGAGYTLFLAGDEAVLTLRGASRKSKAERGKVEIRNSKSGKPPFQTPNTESRTPSVLRMALIGANTNARMTGIDELPGKSNYFIGSDPRKWRTNVSNYAKVSYAGLYPGIDLTFYGNQGQLEYDFVAAPGADPSRIVLNFEGEAAPRATQQGPPLSALRAQPESSADNAGHTNSVSATAKTQVPGPRLRIAANGDLVAKIDGGDVVRFHKPLIYQLEARAERPTSGGQAAASNPLQRPAGGKRFVEGRYVLQGRHRVAFEIGTYDHSRPLVIDPALMYSTYLGGNSTDQADAVAVDASGDAYVTGLTSSSNFPTTSGAFQTDLEGQSDVFVTKLNAAGSALIYSTYLGGAKTDAGTGIALAASGNAWLTGYTYSSDFPITSGALQTTYRGKGDAFVAELDATGSRLVFSTYVGGSGFDDANAVLLDSSDHAFVAGWTDSSDFPTTNGAFQAKYGGGPDDAFVFELNSGGSALIYSTYLGGGQLDVGYGITLDASGDAYVAGATESSNFPTTREAFQTTLNAPVAGFLTKLNTTGSALVYSSYLGGSGSGTSPCAACATGVAVDISGNAYVAGLTWETDFPVTAGAFQTAYAGGFHDAFVAKLNPAGSALVYSTYLGGSHDDGVIGITVDSAGNAYLRGNTFSDNFPISPGAFQSIKAGWSDAFFSELDTTGSALVYSTYLGGKGHEFGRAGSTLVLSGAVNPNVYLTGYTNSTDFPASSGAFQTRNAGGAYDAFVAEFAAALDVGLSPTSLLFSNRKVGTTSPPHTITLTNVGKALLTVKSISLTGVNGGDFAETHQCGQSVLPQASCTISVVFAPTGSGPRQAAVSISDDTPGSPHTVSLRGIGAESKEK